MPSPRPARFLDRLRTLPPSVFDVALGAVFWVALLVELVRGPSVGRAEVVVAAGLAFLLAASLAVRRRVPLASLLLGTLALTVQSFLHIPSALAPVATQIEAYSVGLYATRARARLGLPIIVVGVLLYFAGTPGITRLDPVAVAQVVVVWLATWTVGYSFARRREEQERARRAVARQVVAEERIRMSRELHDLVGHTVNLLVVQAGAARLTLEQDPAAARQLLAGMENTGRETLADLDRVLAALRAEPDGGPDMAEAVPAPGLAQLPDLVSRFSDSGLDVTLAPDPDLALPPDVDLSVYRIVQESLTNALKHAAPCAATVVVHRQDHCLVVTVSDTGPGRRGGRRNGRGLQGIAERVSAHGGVLEHGNGPVGGFVVRAELPLPQTPARRP